MADTGKSITLPCWADEEEYARFTLKPGGFVKIETSMSFAILSSLSQDRLLAWLVSIRGETA